MALKQKFQPRKISGKNILLLIILLILSRQRKFLFLKKHFGEKGRKSKKLTNYIKILFMQILCRKVS